MDDKKFGDILSERRKRLGLSIDQAVSATKLRPQVLEAFERSDFKSMPPKGYAQGMLSSYARFLRLDPRDVLEPYFDQLYLYERDREFANRSDRSNRYESPYEISRRRTGIGNTGRRESDGLDDPTDFSSSRRRSGGFSEDRSVGNVYSRYHKRQLNRASDDLYTDPEDAQSDYEPAPRRYSSNRRSQLGTGYDEYSNYDKSAARRRSSSNSGGIGALLDLVPLPRQITLAIIAVIALVILLIIFGNILGSCSKKEEPVAPETKMVTPTLNETQTTNASAHPQAESSRTSSGQALPAVNENGNTIVKYTVKEGEESYMEIVLDGVSVLAETVKGPKTETFTVKDSITIMANSPRSVQITKNDKVVAMETVANIGRVTITADKPGSKESTKSAETSKSGKAQSNKQ